MDQKKTITYSDSGVDVHRGYEVVQRIKAHVASTRRKEVLSDIGGFGALFKLDLKKYQNPVLVSGTDGVGTKLKIAFMANRHDTVGIDAVAMCVNDIAVSGAEPLFFLDYLATGKISPEQMEAVISGIAEGCRQAGCALVGGETAEMPGFYEPGEYDIAGFSVGAVDEDKIINGSTIQEGDLLIGIPSSGLHSNGFSLVRKVLVEREKLPFDRVLPELGKPLGEVLLTPTRIYVKLIQSLINQRLSPSGMAHITGGGFIENIPRMLPEGLSVEIQKGSWPVLPIFSVLQKLGPVEEAEMYNTFNMGIGLVMAVPELRAQEYLKAIEFLGDKGYLMGKVVKGNGEVILR